jgi:membrane protein CcdC involved in cytochrome C biogenesis
MGPHFRSSMNDLDLFLKVTGSFSMISVTLLVINIITKVLHLHCSNLHQRSISMGPHFMSSMNDLDLFLKVTGPLSMISVTLLVINITLNILDPDCSNLIQRCFSIRSFTTSSMIDLHLFFKVTGQFPMISLTMLVINIHVTLIIFLT